MEAEIKLIDISHSGFNREEHQENKLRGMAFQATTNNVPHEYRAKEISSTGRVSSNLCFFTQIITRKSFYEIILKVLGLFAHPKRRMKMEKLVMRLFFLYRSQIRFRLPKLEPRRTEKQNLVCLLEYLLMFFSILKIGKKQFIIIEVNYY